MCIKIPQVAKLDSFEIATVKKNITKKRGEKKFPHFAPVRTTAQSVLEEASAHQWD